MIPDRVIHAVSASVVVIVLGLFVALFGTAIASVWQGTQRPTYNDGFLYVATGLATLVGGVIAVALNLPVDRQPGQPAQGINKTFAWIGDNLTAILATIYVVVYFLVGLVATATWIARPDQTSDLVKNLAVTVVGLFLPLVSSFFSLPTGVGKRLGLLR